MGVCVLALYQGLCTTKVQVEEPRRRWKPKPGKFVRELKRRLSQLEDKERQRSDWGGERRMKWPPGMPPGPPPGRPPDHFAAGTAAAPTGDFALDAIPNPFCMYPRRLSVCYIVAFSDNSHLVKPVAGAGAATGPVPPCFFGIGTEAPASFGVGPLSPGAAEGAACLPAREAVPVPVNAGISLKSGCVHSLFCSAACDVPTVTSIFKDAEAPAVTAVPVENIARVVEAVPVVAGARPVETMPGVPPPSYAESWLHEVQGQPALLPMVQGSSSSRPPPPVYCKAGCINIYNINQNGVIYGFVCSPDSLIPSALVNTSLTAHLVDSTWLWCKALGWPQVSCTLLTMSSAQAGPPVRCGCKCGSGPLFPPTSLGPCKGTSSCGSLISLGGAQLFSVVCGCKHS